MPSEVFPVQASYSTSAGLEFPGEVLEIYDDLNFRSYGLGETHQSRRLVFEDISKEEYESIRDFIINHKNPTVAFYVYDPLETNEPDLDGSTTTGRHTAIFPDGRFDFALDGPCSYSGELTVLFLD